MSNKLVEILMPVTVYEYEIIEGIINCHCEGDGTIGVKKSLFELFLLTNEKLEWELNYSEAGEHIQKTGSMTYDEYWEQDMPYVYQDLSEYITKQLIND